MSLAFLSLVLALCAESNYNKGVLRLEQGACAKMMGQRAPPSIHRAPEPSLTRRIGSSSFLPHVGPYILIIPPATTKFQDNLGKTAVNRQKYVRNSLLLLKIGWHLVSGVLYY